MKIPIIDLGVLAKFLLPAMILAGIVVYFFMRQIVVFLWRMTHSTKVIKTVGALREVKSKKTSVVVRKTDMFAQLSSEQKKIYMRAKDLVELQQFVEAAKLLESIKFQRKAIDLLEGHGFVDEACSILIRMGVPYRAAVIYERNGQYLKASEFFLKDGKIEQAGRCFEKLAEKDFNFFRQAGQCFLRAGLIDSCLSSYSRIAENAEVLRIALEHKRYEFLQRYLDLPLHAQTLLSQLTEVQLQALVSSLALTPQSALSLAHWTMYRPDDPMILAALTRLGSNQHLAHVYWSRLDDNFSDYICNLLASLPKVPDGLFLQTHLEVLSKLGRDAYAERLGELIAQGSGKKPTVLAIGL